MDDARIPPFRGSLESEDISSKDCKNDASAEDALTHRPRDYAKLSSSALRLASSKGAIVPDPEEANPDRPIRGISAEELPDLRPFADQLTAIAEQLRSGVFPSVVFEEADQAQNLRPSQGDTATSSINDQGHAARLEGLAPQERRQAFADLARATYARRRKRTSIFGDPELFGEPGWDILLDLYIAQVEEKPVSVSSACIGSAAPPTTGLRWLGVLAEQGLVEREHDARDQRRVLVRLTDKALEAMDDYFLSSASMQRDRRTAPRA
ncbi:MAG: winged helix DNA-binding protein [Pseudomonadota bacterium]